MIPLCDGRPSLREFCVACGLSNGGTRLGFALPMTADNDILVPSFKYKDKTLGHIAQSDPNYLKWLILHSKSSGRIKKSAARILAGDPYTPPQDGDVYPQEKKYDLTASAVYLKQIREQSQYDPTT